jgi:hypothetical protein
MVYRQLPGQADSPEREPERVQPVPEHYEGVNFPYRGTEKHGVEVPADARYGVLESDYAETEKPDEYLEPEPEPEPIPVRVVNSTARERLDWRATRFLVKDTAAQILGRHEKRKAVRIRNHDATNPIYIGNDAGMQPYTGYLIPAGTELYPFLSTEDIWAVSDSGTEVEISIMYEFAVEL